MSSSENKKKRGFPGKKGRRNDTDKAWVTARAALITVIVVAVLFLASLFLNSNYLRQKMTAVTIDNVKYSLTDFNFYYKNMYLQYYQSMGNTGINSLLPDTQKSLKSQIYDQETGETWAEFFTRTALDQMKEDNRIYIEAQKAGFELSEEDKQEIEREISNVLGMAVTYGYPDLDSYLRAVYGKGMNETYFRKATERAYLVDAYTKYVRDAFVYTPEELEAFYNEKKDSYDTFTYRYFLVKADEVNEEDYEDEAALEEAKKQALAAAGAKAEAYVAAITDEQSFIDKAREYDAELYKDDDATLRVYKGELLGATYGDWLKEAGRSEGDVSAFESTNGYYVVYFVSRSDNHYKTVDAQMIRIAPDEVNANLYTDDQEGYDAAVAKAKEEAKELAEKINDEWLAAGATQEKLSELAETYLADITESGLTENIYRKQMPDEVDAWLYDPERKAGDHTLIYSETMGYYILYFAGPGEQYSDVLADEGKRDTDLKSWKDSLPVAEPKTTWILKLANL